MDKRWLIALAAILVVAGLGGYMEDTTSSTDAGDDSAEAGSETQPPRGSTPTPTPHETDDEPEPDKLTVAACERWLVLRTEIESGHTTGTEARDGVKRIYDEYGRFAEVSDVRQAFSALLTAATQGDSDAVVETADRLSGACRDANAT